MIFAWLLAWIIDLIDLARGIVQMIRDHPWHALGFASLIAIGVLIASQRKPTLGEQLKRHAPLIERHLPDRDSRD